MTRTDPPSHGLAKDPAVSGLSTRKPTPFSLRPAPAVMADLAAQLGLDGLRKLSFTGQIRPLGKRGWLLEATLGATVTQPCVVSLAPVTTRLDEPVLRRFVPAAELDEIDSGAETEMSEDDTTEPLGDTIPLRALMAEALSLSLPSYPRAEGVSLETAQFAEPGVAPLKDEDTKPFAGLQALRDKLGDDTPG